MNKKQHEKEILENEIVTWTEKNFGHLRPHLPVIGICAGLIIVICILFVYYQELNKNNKAMPWNAFNMAVSQTRMTGDTRMLTRVAEEYPENTAGLWALQLAADFELRSGISQFGEDEVVRKEGMDKVRKARDMYQRIVDTKIDKTPMLQRRSLFGLAYASESMGDFKAAKDYYRELGDDGGDSPFLDAAKRGEVRTTNPEYLALFNKFKEWKDTPGDAPGPVLPPRPDIGFPPSDSTPNEFGGGAFEPPTTPPATTDDSAADTPTTSNPAENPDQGNTSQDTKKSESDNKAADPDSSTTSDDPKKGDG